VCVCGSSSSLKKGCCLATAHLSSVNVVYHCLHVVLFLHLAVSLSDTDTMLGLSGLELTLCLMPFLFTHELFLLLYSF